MDVVIRGFSNGCVENQARMKTVGTRILLFAGAFFIYAQLNNESHLVTTSVVIAAIGVGLMLFGPKK